MTVIGIQLINETTDHEIDVIDTLAPNGAIEVKQHGTQTNCKVGKDDINAQPLQTIFVPLPGGEQIAFKSLSDEDKPTGTGVSEIHMHYISSTDGLAKHEVITLNGTTPVFSVATDVAFINQLHASKGGSGANPNDICAAGDIWAMSSSYAANGRIYQVIEAGKNFDDSAQFMVPKDKILTIEEVRASTTKKSTLVTIRANTFEGFIAPIGLWVDLWQGGVLDGDTSGGNGHLDIPLFALPGTILKATAFSKEAGADVSISWGGILIDASSIKTIT